MKRDVRAFWRTVVAAGGLLTAVPAALVAGFLWGFIAGMFVAGVASLFCLVVGGFAILVAAVPPARPPDRGYWAILGVGVILLGVVEAIVAVWYVVMELTAASPSSWT